MIRFSAASHAISYWLYRIVSWVCLFPLALAGQNQSPVVVVPLPDQIMDQAGLPVDLDLNDFINDPDVSSPAV